MVAGVKKARRAERQHTSPRPGGRALFWLVVLALAVVVIGIWVSAMIFL